MSFSIPRSRSLRAVTGPTPHNASTGNDRRNGSTRSGAITVSPSGLCHPDAILARNLFGATPAEAVSPVFARISSLSLRATVMPSVSPHTFSVTSKYASSSESGSTSGVTDRNNPNTCCDTVRDFEKSGGTMTSDGHRRTARAIEIAERTPNALAS